MRQQGGADAAGPPASCEPRSPRSEALVLALSRLARGQAQRAESLRSARVALTQLRLVATPPDGPRRVRAKIVNSISWGLRRSPCRVLPATPRTPPGSCAPPPPACGLRSGGRSA